jgi:hypothetical protein
MKTKNNLDKLDYVQLVKVADLLKVQSYELYQTDSSLRDRIQTTCSPKKIKWTVRKVLWEEFKKNQKVRMAVKIISTIVGIVAFVGGIASIYSACSKEPIFSPNSFEEQEIALRKAKERQKKELSSTLRLSGRQYFLKGKYGKALEEYQEADRLEPNDIILKALIGDCHHRLQKFDEAIKVYGDALGISSTDSDKAKIIFKMGEVYENQKKWKLASSCYKRAIGFLKLK